MDPWIHGSAAGAAARAAAGAAAGAAASAAAVCIYYVSLGRALRSSICMYILRNYRRGASRPPIST